MGRRPPNGRLIRRAVDVNITLMRIHIAPAVEARLKPLQPQYARGDFGVGPFRLRHVADDFARLKNRSPQVSPVPDLFPQSDASPMGCTANPCHTCPMPNREVEQGETPLKN